MGDLPETNGTDQTGATPATATAPDKSGNTGTPEKTPALLQMSQDDLNALIAERASRAKQAGINGLLSELGLDDAEALKSLVTKAKQDQDAAKSELEKIQEAAQVNRTKAEALQVELDAERAARIQDKLSFQVQSAAIGSKAFNPDAVFTLLSTQYPDDLKAAIGEGGVIDPAKVASAVGKLRESDAYLFETESPRRTPGSPSNKGGTTPVTDKEAKAQAAASTRNLIRG